MLIFLLMALFLISCGNENSTTDEPDVFEQSSSSATSSGVPDTQSSSSISDEPEVQIAYGTLTDKRDGNEYRTVEIGNREWMADNLNYQTENSMCYDNDPNNCEKYGSLYTWAAALDIDMKFNTTYWNGDYNRPDLHHQGVCPDGWHIPNVLDWEDLIEATGDSLTAGKKLKFELGWHDKAGGFYDAVVDEVFRNIDRNGFWWSVSNNSTPFAYFYGISYDRDYIGHDIDRKTYGFSVRCVRN